MYKVEINGLTYHGQRNTDDQWWLKDGLTGWYDSLSNRVSVDAIPGQHGGFQPSEVLLDARRMAFEGAIDHGTASEAERFGWLTSLAAADGFTVSVTDSAGTLSAQCWVDGQILSKRLSETIWQYSIPLVAPDPLKYGEARTVRKAAEWITQDGLQYPLTYPLQYGSMSPASLSGYMQLSNAGNAPVHPEWRVTGPISEGFQITSDDYVIKLERDLLTGQEVFFGSVAGGRAILRDESGAFTDISVDLTSAGWVSVPAGGQRGYVFAPLGTAGGGSYVEATIKDGWF